ncbi:putative membrane protein [Orientia tsutsugamushi str. UT76]|nr:putative membrane protein [Orientia tsutsugamushi str. UT76]
MNENAFLTKIRNLVIKIMVHCIGVILVVFIIKFFILLFTVKHQNLIDVLLTFNVSIVYQYLIWIINSWSLIDFSSYDYLKLKLVFSL